MIQKKIAEIFLRKTYRLLLQLSFCILFGSVFVSCSSSKKINTNYIYFRDGADTVTALQKETLIQAGDLISIQVSSRTLNQEQAAIFNTPASPGLQAQGYRVNDHGNIEIPVIGALKVAGLTKDKLQTILVQKLTEFVKNPTVIVHFLQFDVNILGEVKKPGLQKFVVDKVTILDALGAAGDLTDNGKREDIKVIREEDGKRITYIIDLRNKTLFQSPVYLLQPNDIVYVSPDLNKLRNLRVNPDAQRRTSLFFGILGSTLAVATLILTISNSN